MYITPDRSSVTFLKSNFSGTSIGGEDLDTEGYVGTANGCSENNIINCIPINHKKIKLEFRNYNFGKIRFVIEYINSKIKDYYIEEICI